MRALVQSVPAMLVFCLVACAAPPAVPASAPVPSPEQLVRDADALDRAFVNAFNQGDPAALSALYWNSPDVVSVAPDVFEPAVGIESLREANMKALAGMPGARVEILQSRQVPAGEVVIGSGTARITIPGQPPTELLVRFTDVKGQRDGKWVYLMDHVSMSAAPPPAKP
jgi:ketosteroid isomerase-like protein